MPTFTCRFLGPGKHFPHYWEHSVGSGHAPLALRADWQAHMQRCHHELGFQHVRFHALLSDAMGTLVCEENKLIYSFFNADRIADFLLSIGMHPLVELSFMPETLASGKKTVFRYRANVTPPSDYGKWTELIHRLAAHSVERYGAAEVRQWPFEVWNEPNMPGFWTGTRDDYFGLYRETARALKDVDSGLQVGGPATAKNAWIPEFLDFCSRENVPVDFVSTHHYPTDARGKISTDTLEQLEHTRPEAMRKQAEKARSQAGDLPLYYTEWGCSSNPRDPLHDEPFSAAFAVRIIMESADLAQSYSYWTFSDIFEENYFPSVPFHGGFGLMNIHGIAKPVYRAFQLLHHLGTERLDVEGRHATVNVWVVRKERSATVLVTNFAMPRHPVQTEVVDVCLAGAPLPRVARIERVDDDHSNARKHWMAMGCPEYLNAHHLEQLSAASALQAEAQPWVRQLTDLQFSITMPPQSVAAVTFESV